MKKYIFIIIATACLAACDIDTAGTGGVYANWQLLSIDTIATGGQCDMSKSSIYWGFESDVMQIRKLTQSSGTKLLFSFKRNGDSITVSNALLAPSKDSLITVDDKSVLEPYGFTDLTETFYIKKTSGSSLILKNRLYLLTFRRY